MAIYPSCIEIPYFSQQIGTENQIFSTILISFTALKILLPKLRILNLIASIPLCVQQMLLPCTVLTQQLMLAVNLKTC